MFSGFPIFADPETAFLNPLNILSVFVFGPLLSYKFLHFGLYILGSFCLYRFLKEMGFTLSGFLVSNTVLFFSFFALYHQQHSSMVFNLYLLPVNLYAVALYLKHRKIRYLILNSLTLSLGFYFGSPQTVFLLLIIGLWFLFCFGGGLVRSLTSFLALSFLLLPLVVPSLYPAFMLSGESSRTDRIYKEGSMIPPLVLNLVTPFGFNRGGEYSGNKIDEDYNEHEIYFFVGVTSAALAVLGFFSPGDGKLRRFSLLLFCSFVILGFLRYVPGSDYLSFPPISLFRYWLRSSMLGVLAISLMSGYFVSHLGERFVIKTRTLLTLLLPFAFLILLTLLNLRDKHMRRFFANLGDNYYTSFLLFFLLVLAIFFLVSLRPFKSSLLKVFLAALVVSELFYFGNEIVSFRLFDFMPVSPVGYEKRRVIDRRFYANEYLYSSSWSIFGYSQLVSKAYTERLNGLGLGSTKGDNNVSPEQLASLRELGVSAIVGKVTSNPYRIFTRELDLIDGDVSGKYLTKKEGNVIFEVNLTEAREVEVLIRKDTGWKILLNGNRIDPASSTDGLFYKVSLPQGKSVLNFMYSPILLLRSLKVSLFLMLFIYPILLLLHKVQWVRRWGFLWKSKISDIIAKDYGGSEGSQKS